MALYCSACGTPMPDNSAFCPKCGSKAPGVAAVGGGAAAGQVGGLTENVAGMLAYVTIIPAIIFLVLEPYNRNRFVRFHAFQSLFFCVAWIIVNFLWVVPVLGAVIMGVLHLAFFIAWIVLLIKAYGGQMFKLPVIGDIAEKQASAA